MESKRLCRGSWAAVRLLREANLSFAYYDTCLDPTITMHPALLSGLCVRFLGQDFAYGTVAARHPRASALFYALSIPACADGLC